MQITNELPDDKLTLKMRISQLEESIFNKNKIIEILTKKDEAWQTLFDYNTQNNRVMSNQLYELHCLHLNYSDKFQN